MTTTPELAKIATCPWPLALALGDTIPVRGTPVTLALTLSLTLTLALALALGDTIPVRGRVRVRR